MVDSQRTVVWLNSRRQLRNRLVHRLTEPVRSSVHPSIKTSVYIRTGYSEPDIVSFIGFGVPVVREPRIGRRRRGDNVP